MDNQPGARAGRREEISQRLDAIHQRLAELRARPGHQEADLAAVSQRLAAAQHQMTASRAAAGQAMAASIRAFRQAAQAHERVARLHERALAAGLGNRDDHERQAARHRAAALADTQRAGQTQQLSPEDGGSPGPPSTRSWPKAPAPRAGTSTANTPGSVTAQP